VLWRRTKHKLHLDDAQQQAFTQWFNATFAAPAPLRAHAG
jgi:glycerol-3-phosphate dehydrogenase